MSNMYIRKAILGLIITLLSGSGALAAADFHKGQNAFYSGDYQTALAELIPLAEKGHSNAQHRLAHMYFVGAGVPKDFDTARDWITKAAVQANAEAQVSLGIWYTTGTVVPQSGLKAYMWFSLAADNGSDAATKYIKIFEDELSYAEISKAQKMSSICLESNYTDC